MDNFVQQTINQNTIPNNFNSIFMNNFFNQNTNISPFPFNAFNLSAPQNISNVNMGTAIGSNPRFHGSRLRSHNYSSTIQTNSQPYPVNFGNNGNFINYNNGIFNLHNVYQSNNNQEDEFNDNISFNSNQINVRMRNEIIAKMLKINYENYIEKFSKKEVIHEYFDV